MNNNLDITKHILIVFLILSFLVNGYLLYNKKQAKNETADAETRYNQLKNKYNNLLTEQNATLTPTPSSTPTVADDWKTYENEKYGFQLTFGNLWKGYKVERDDSFDFYNGVCYRIYIPTVSAKWQSSKQGYADPFVISVYKLADWEELQKEEGPKGTLIDKNDTYAFNYSMWQDCPEDLCDEITSDEIKKVINSFEFTE